MVRRPGKDFRGVGAGIQRQRQYRAVQPATEKSVQQVGALNDFQAVHPRIEHQQLYIQRRSAENPGKQPNWETNKFIAGNAANREENRHDAAHHHLRNQQP